MEVRTGLVIVLLILSSLSPVVGATQSYQEPDPDIGVAAPGQVTVGEQFTITVEGANYGGTAGKYSTISVSFPRHQTDSHIDSVYTDLSFDLTREEGDTIYDKYGNEMVADYALAEAGVGGSGTWYGGSRRQMSVRVTPQEAGTFVFYARVTLTDDDDPDRKFNAPSTATRTTNRTSRSVATRSMSSRRPARWT
ncbi:hypothetical protein [Halorussus caseinilyticus]|uniref:CARDB domain-containing protein n=1 Tax=Halorussus caseinilyticus TaxID=3034025 RepID=A0ABD5WHL0_9EURY